MIYWQRIVVLLCLIALAACATHLPVAVSQSRLAPDRQERVVKEIKKAMAKGDITGLSVAFVDKEGPIWSGNFGYADKVHKQVATDQTLYRIASITKLFTAMAITQLHEKGLLRLDDRISKYLPELKVAACFGGPEITVSDLLTHQSGLPHSYEPDFWSGNDWHSVEAELKCDIVPYRPRFIVSYSNVGYVLLGSIVEKISGEPYPQYIKDHILAPLNIQDAAFELQGKLSDERFITRISHAYDFSGRESVEPPLRDLPAGGIYATADALGKFLSYFLQDASRQNRGVFQTHDTMMEMLSPHGLESALAMDVQVGWGWFLNHSPDGGPDFVAQHDGSAKYHHGRVILSPLRGTGIVLLANSGSREVLQSLSKELFVELAAPIEFEAKQLPEKRQSRQVEFCSNDKIPGYYHSDLGLIKVEPSGEDFTAKADQARLRLNHTESNYFDPSIRLFGLLSLGKNVFGDLQLSLRCTDEWIYAAIKDKSEETPVAYQVHSDNEQQLDDKWLGRYTLTGAGDEQTYLRVWRENGTTLMESEHLPVSDSKKVFLLSPQSPDQVRVLYLNDQWGPLVSFSESPQGLRANYQGFTFVRTAT